VSATALVTGGRGFAGAWLARALLEQGDEVVCFDRTPLPDGRPSTLGVLGLEGEVVEVEGDLRDAAAVGEAVRANGVDTVYHLAAQVLVHTAAASPEPTFDSNVRGTWTVLEACREHGVERVVVASSDKAYGAHEELPYREHFALQPTAPYEASKAAADLIARSYWPSYGLPVAVTRFANLYGGGDTNWSRLIPEAVVAAVDGRSPVLRSDGSPERDFLYVEDAARAYLAIAAALDREEVRGEAFNAGGGAPYSVGDVVRIITRLAGTGVEPDIQGAGNPEGEIDRQYVDPAKLQQLTGWSPAVNLEDGLGRTIEWYRDHPDVRPATV
jgi:CDP-glucose 4,6-dehydratase